MVMRNRSTPIAIRKSMAQHLVAMASADVRGYLDTPEPAPSAGSKATKATRTPIKRIDTCELVEQAIDHGTTVSFDISSVTTRGETEEKQHGYAPSLCHQAARWHLVSAGNGLRRPRHRRYAAHRRDRPYEKRQHAPARRQEALRRPGRGRRLLRRIRPSAAHSTTRTAHSILY